MHTFDGHDHSGIVRKIVYLFGEVISSVDGNGTVIAWNASSGAVLSKVQAGIMAIVGDKKLVFGTDGGYIDVVSHEGGNARQFVQRLKSGLCDAIRRIAVHGDVFFPASWDKSGLIRKSHTFEKVAALKENDKKL